MHPKREKITSIQIETAGEILSDGSTTELLLNPETAQLFLLFTDGKNSVAADRIERKGRIYVPVQLGASIMRAVRLPDQASDYDSTESLFCATRQIFSNYRFSNEVAAAATYFAFSSWFPDCIPAAPCLLVTGPKPEAALFFQLLACVVRHPLQLTDFNRSSLSSLMKVQPTLLFGQDLLSGSKLRMLLASSHPDTLVVSGDTLVSLYAAKAIYRGLQFEDGSSDYSLLRINLMPLRGKLPILDVKTQTEITRKFQRQMVSYRIKNVQKVRDSIFDFSWLTAGPRILARVFGSCIVDSPVIQLDLTQIFQRQQQAIREHAWLDKRCIVIEAGLALCHSKSDNFFAFVGDFTDHTNTILKARGSNQKLEPRELGSILRSLGLYPKRKKEGCAISMTNEIRGAIHRLAFDFDVAAVIDGKPGCPQCRDVVKSDNADVSPGPENGKSPQS